MIPKPARSGTAHAPASPDMTRRYSGASLMAFYFVITVLVLTEVVQSRYKKKLLQRQKSQRK